MLVVDAANVIGARPNGWWRDRAGAARRLYADLRAAVGDGRLPGPVVVVLEGAARAGVGVGTGIGTGTGEVDGPVRVVHAPAAGDDEIVAQAAAYDDVTVVTADRELRARVEAVGAATVGPGWLWARLG